MSKQACMDRDYVRNIGDVEDVLGNILSRLPIKNILPWKLVSKSWCRLIGGLEFAQLQFSCSSEEQKYIMLIDDDYTGLGLRLSTMNRFGKISPYTTVPTLDEDCVFGLVCSFNGLVCFVKSLCRQDNVPDICICNPATKEILELPKGSPSTKPLSVGIIFYPNKSQYKVLRFFSDTSPECLGRAHKCEIYSPGDADWRVIPGVLEPPRPIIDWPTSPIDVSVGGRNYWLVWSKSDIDKPDHILSIDMDENIARISLPNTEPERFSIFTFLIEYEGRLAVITVDETEEYVGIWSLTNPVESSWSHEREIQLWFAGDFLMTRSIVSIRNELMFIFGEDGHHFKFLNLGEGSWRRPTLASMFEERVDGSDFVYNNYKLKKGRLYASAALPFSETLFRCDASY